MSGKNRVSKSLVRLLLMGFAGLIWSTAVAAEELQEAKKLSPAQIPAKVMDTVKARLPGAEVSSAEKETENGTVVYDVELKHQGRKYEMDIKEDGTLTEIEIQVMFKDVLAKVTKTVKAKYPDATVKEVMEVDAVKGKEETPQHYEVAISTGGKEKEVIVSLDGKSIKEEAAEEKPKK